MRSALIRCILRVADVLIAAAAGTVHVAARLQPTTAHGLPPPKRCNTCGRLVKDKVHVSKNTAVYTRAFCALCGQEWP